MVEIEDGDGKGREMRNEKGKIEVEEEKGNLNSLWRLSHFSFFLFSLLIFSSGAVIANSAWTNSVGSA
ncbi:MAG TPA: hypothetical protein VGY99_11510 [Candidatus Binataceae bacterium]|jgi:hypothetical protein|nr:hypothetical protein [Candidatus Binataceae bacterium]